MSQRWRVSAVRYHVHMGITYSAHEAKARFAEMLRHVREGETVTVSYGGEPVAEVRPLTERGGTPGPQGSAADRSETVVGKLVRELENRDPGKTPEQRLQDVIRRGIVVPSSQPDRPLKPVARVPGALARFLAERGRPWES